MVQHCIFCFIIIFCFFPLSPESSLAPRSLPSIPTHASEASLLLKTSLPQSPLQLVLARWENKPKAQIFPHTVSLGLGLSTGWFGKRWSACHSCHMSVSPRGPRPSVTCHRVMRAAAQCDGGLQWWRRYGRLHTGGERRWDCGAPLLCCRRARLTHGLRIRGGPWSRWCGRTETRPREILGRKCGLGNERADRGKEAGKILGSATTRGRTAS